MGRRHVDAGHAPIQALELGRGFAKAIQEWPPEAQREVVQRVFQRIAGTDDRVTDVDVYPIYDEALGCYWRPEPTVTGRSTDAQTLQDPIDALSSSTPFPIR